MPLDPGITAQLVQTGGNIPGLIPWNWFAQAGQREHQYQMTDYLYSKDLEQWNRQNEWNLSMWNKQNEYNSPAQQMARYKAAGLNPNLIYGQGSPGLATPMPQAQSPQAKGQAVNNKIDVPPIDFVRVYMDFTRQAQEIKNMEEARKNLIKDGNIKLLDTMIKGYDAGMKPWEIKRLVETYEQEKKLWPGNLEAQKQNINKLKAEVAKMGSEIGLNNAQLAKLQIWLENWLDHGINIERDNATQRKVIEGVDFIFDGLGDIPENWNSRKGLMPWQKEVNGKVVNIWENE